MSDTQNAVLTALGDGPLTTDDITEATGYERLVVAQALQALAKAGAVRSGRGGWRPVDESGEAPRLAAAHIVVHEAAPPNVEPPPKKRGRPPGRLATVSQLGDQPRAAVARSPASDYTFGISESGELLVTTDGSTKFARFSPADTARLFAMLERFRTLIPTARAA